MILTAQLPAAIRPEDFSEIAGDPLASPLDLAPIAGNALRARGLPDSLVVAAREFARGTACAVHIKRCHDCSALSGDTPFSMLDSRADWQWRHSALVALGLMDVFGVKPVAFAHENRGKMFANLVAEVSSQGRLAKNSIEEMGGHTDFLNHPFSHEFTLDSFAPPAPDLVSLIGLRNPRGTATFVAPLTRILAQLTSPTIDELMKPQFVFDRQPSMDADFDYRPHNWPVLGIDPKRGYVIRYSRSKVHTDPRNIAAKQALAELASIVPLVRQSIVIAPSDILMLNNRTAVHGRERVDVSGANSGRWLVRGYGYAAETKGHSDPTRPFVMRSAA